MNLLLKSIDIVKLIQKLITDYILKNLRYPNDVWEDEFEEKLEEIDREFLFILFFH